MATNKPPVTMRARAVRKRSQLKTKIEGEKLDQAQPRER